MEQTFNIGDRVRIIKNSRYYGEDTNNPKDVSGTVIDNNQSTSMRYRVEWDNNSSNSYHPYDLEYVPTENKFKVGDRVRIKKNSGYYGTDENNCPKDISGTITYINKTGTYDVNWDNGDSNCYYPIHLELAPTENGFKVGDRVRIKSNSRYYRSDEKHNPKDISGKITSIRNSCGYHDVDWDNGGTNCYYPDHLEIVPNEEIAESNHGFSIGDKVKIKLNGNGVIDTMDYNTDIPQVIHGSRITNGDGEVIGFHNELIVVRFTDHKGNIVQLGFRKEVLTLINNKQKQHDKSKNTSGIKVCRATPTISTNQRSTGNGIRGNRKRATITIGCLGYKEVIGQ